VDFQPIDPASPSEGNHVQKAVVFALALTSLIAVNATGSVTNVSSLLDRANHLNAEELQMARSVQDKARDNQALIAFATVLAADHRANENALLTLSRQKKIGIEGTSSSSNSQVEVLDRLQGVQFKEAFLSDEINRNEEALDYFLQAKQEFMGDPQVEYYIGRTIPILNAHLELARNLQHAMTQEKLISSLLLLGYD